METWRDIKGYEGLYRVSDTGEIYSVRSDKVLSPSLNHKGYYTIYLRVNGDRRKFYIHRLVKSAFDREPLENEQVNHKDGNKLNNKIDNLDWVSPRENMLHAYSSGLHKISYGKDVHNTRKVAQYDMDNNFIRDWDCMADAAKSIGGTSGNISACCIGKDNRGKNILSYKGYRWKYIKEVVPTWSS